MPLKLHTPADALPVSVQEAKLHCRIIADMNDVDPYPEDDLIESLISAATLDAEHLMGRAVMPQKWQVTLDAFAASIDLQRPPVTAIESIQYVDAAGILRTLPDTEYQFVGASDYTARVVPAYGKAWPDTRSQPEAVRVVFSCGYADATSVPALIKTWIKLRIGALYENRETWTADGKIEQNEHIDYLLDRYRTCLL